MAKRRKVDDDEESDEEEQEEESEQEIQENEEDIAKLLEPLNKEQLIDIIRATASDDHPKILEEIHRVADLDPTHRKLFVHGLGPEITSEKLRDVFNQYGELEHCNVVTGKFTGRSQGYGILLFKHRSSAQKALKEPQKKIGNRMSSCQLASEGAANSSYPQHHQQQPQPQPPQQQPQPQSPQQQPQHQPPQQQLHHQPVHSAYQSSQDNIQRKIHVGNVHSEIPGDRLLAFFSKYGEIEEGPLGFDIYTGKSKGCALFIYKTVEGARKALEEPSKIFEGHQLYCQKVTDKQMGCPATARNVQSGQGYIAGGYNLPGGVGFNASAMLGQGFMGRAQHFGQGIPQFQAALAVLGAAGQNPAAFNVPPVIAPFNPGLATMPQAMQGYGMSNTGYQNTQAMQDYGMSNTGYQNTRAMQSYGMSNTGYQNTQAMQGLGMANTGYQNTQALQANSSYPTGAAGQGSTTRPPTMG